jgi:hypothetical protein
MGRIFSLPVVSATAVAVSAILLLALVWKPLQRWRRAREAARALRAFRIERELLEAKCFDLASRLGKPRGLRWLDCDWLDGVTFARDLNTGLLTAFVAVNVRFEAVEGGDMEGVEAVSMVRDAAAVFHYRRTLGTGAVLFNMNPRCVARLGNQFVPVTVEAEPLPGG